MAKNNSRFGIWLLVAVLIIICDQLSKAMAVRMLAHGQRRQVIDGFFDLTLLYNKGAAFSFLSSAAGWQRWMFIGIGVAAALFITYLLMRHGGQRLFSFALALILGGAIGNVIDRIFRGQVVDFILLYYQKFHWPAFNVADSAITVGAVLLIVDEIRRVRASRG